MGYYQAGDLSYMMGDPGFFDWVGGALKSVGTAALGVARTVVPIAAPIVGGIFGGPAGATLGAGLGSLFSGGGSGAPDPMPPGGGSALGAISAFAPVVSAFQAGARVPPPSQYSAPYNALPQFTEPPRSVQSTHGPAADVDLEEEEFFEEEES